MASAWIGKAVPINRKSATSKKWMRKNGHSVLVGTIRTTDEYKKFLSDLAICFSDLKKLGKSWSCVWLTARLGPLADIDGIIKPVFDAIQSSGSVDNDRQIRELHYRCYFHGRDEPDVIIVDIEELEWDPKIFPTQTDW